MKYLVLVILLTSCGDTTRCWEEEVDYCTPLGCVTDVRIVCNK